MLKRRRVSTPSRHTTSIQRRYDVVRHRTTSYRHWNDVLYTIKWMKESLLWQIMFMHMSTAQKMKFSINDFLSKCDQIRSFLRIWSHLLKKSLMENFIFCVVEDADCLSSPDAKNAANNIHKDYVVVPIYKTNRVIFLVFKRSFASVITGEWGLNDDTSTDTHTRLATYL